MTPSRIEPTTFVFVAQYLNHCATAVPIFLYFFKYLEHPQTLERVCVRHLCGGLVMGVIDFFTTSSVQGNVVAHSFYCILPQTVRPKLLFPLTLRRFDWM
jgi:hypothetical protein